MSVTRQLRDEAIGIVHAAKGDGARRASLRAGGGELTVRHFAALGLGLVLRLMDALDAERAFLHHTAAAGGHIRGELILQSLNGLIPARVVKIAPVEGTHLVRAVVGAVTRTHTAVVNLQVDLLGLRMYR